MEGDALRRAVADALEDFGDLLRVMDQKGEFASLLYLVEVQVEGLMEELRQPGGKGLAFGDQLDLSRTYAAAKEQHPAGLRQRAAFFIDEIPAKLSLCGGRERHGRHLRGHI